MSAGGAEYYLDKVANNVDDYYLGRGEAPGQWVGTAAEQLGLIGQVDAEASGISWPGCPPAESPWVSRLRPDRRPGYDLTFSAPEGRVVALGLRSRRYPRRHLRAHDRAVGAVLDQLSTEACFARRGQAGRELVEANGFIGAAFRHRTSRAGDPQLHTHVVVPNLVQGSDGRWSAPDGRHLYTWQKSAGTLYQSALRAELAPLGLAWQVRRNGLGEVARIPKTSCGRSRSAGPTSRRPWTTGGDLGAAAETAALATRARKPDEEAHVDLLRERWPAQLASLPAPGRRRGSRPAGLDDLTTLRRRAGRSPRARDLEACFSPPRRARLSLDDWEIDEQRHPTPAALEARSMPVTLLGSTFSRRDAISAVARAFDVTPKEAVELTAELLDRDSVVRVLADPGVAPDRVRTSSGQLVPTTSGDRRYSTTDSAAEERITRSAWQGREGTARSVKALATR